MKTTYNFSSCNFNAIALPTKRFNYYFRLSEVLRNSVYVLLVIILSPTFAWSIVT